MITCFIWLSNGEENKVYCILLHWWQVCEVFCSTWSCINSIVSKFNPLTMLNRVLGKLIVAQLVKEMFPFYEKNIRYSVHPFLSCDGWIQATLLSFFLGLVLISSSMLCWDLKVVSLLRVCLLNFYMHFHFRSMHSTGTSHLIFLDMMFLAIFCKEYRGPHFTRVVSLLSWCLINIIKGL